MNKKLLAVAVAGALALPGLALAQSSVTISGFLKMSWGQYKLGNMNAARAAGTNNTETRLTDDSSRIVFNIREDLGGGLAAIGQIDWRVAPDSASDGGGPAGNNHIGLRSSQWGTIIAGRQDLHYYNRESNLTAKGDLKSDSISLLAYINKQSVANATRTPNTVRYTSPSWGGFDFIVAYSSNPLAAAENDIGSNVRKGQGWNINPNMKGSNWQIGYSYWNAKSDATRTINAVAVTDVTTYQDQRADRVYGSYSWGGFMLGLAWDSSEVKNYTRNNIAGATVEARAKRTAWSLPMQYTWGPHGIFGHYTEAKDIKNTSNTGAKMYAITYAYDLSKRTSFAVNYSQIKNEAGASYDFFTTASGAIGTPTSSVLAGEDPRNLSITLRHAF